MRRIFLACTIAACLGVIGGCGGGSDFFPSPFEGGYQGSFDSSNTSDQGTVTMAVDKNGQLSGTFVDNGSTPAVTLDISGVIQDNGDVTGDLTNSSDDFPFGGNLAFDNRGNLSGPVNITVTGTGVIHATFDLTPVAKKKFGTRLAPTPNAVKPTAKAMITAKPK